jgi:tetratricopeptide (TPR) repeat protein
MVSSVFIRVHPWLRLAPLLLSLASGGLAAWLIVCDAPAAFQEPDPAPPFEIRRLEAALRGNAVSPYRWVELAEGYERNGDGEKARFSFHRAIGSAPNLPPVWIRAAAYHFRLGDGEEGLRAGAHAQSISGTSDAFLFQYYERYVADALLVTRALAGDRRSLSAWFRRLQARRDSKDAALAWAEMDRRKFTDVPLATSYVAFLLDQRRYEEARQVWLKAAPPGPAGDRIYNGGFEQDPSGCRLDWTLAPIPGVEMERDTSVVKEGSSSLCVRFQNCGNVALNSPAQTAVVSQGRYRLSAWLKTEGVTSDQGVALCVTDAESPERLTKETEPLLGTNAWTEIQTDFFVPLKTNLIDISVCRQRSKYYSGIAGAVWVDAVSLRPVVK